MIEYIKILFLKLYCNLILLGNTDLNIIDRVISYWEVFKKLGPVAFLLSIIGLWFNDNKGFFLGAIFFIILNAFLGMYMHKKKGSFKWDIFFEKTLMMTIVIIISYAVLEIVITIAGNNTVIDGFRALIQVSTLLFPGSKILKNIFVLSNGEHPPKWLMMKVYNFKENGDLAEFLNTNKSKEDLYKNIEKKAEDIKEDISNIKDLDDSEL